MAQVSTIVVTGASGFIGAHIVKACLQKGYNVNACVCVRPHLSFRRAGTVRARSLFHSQLLTPWHLPALCDTRRNKDDPKNDFLKEMNNLGGGKIELYSADLVTPGAYDDACASAEAVIHAAAHVDPFDVVDPVKDMIEPSTEGVKNILGSVNKCPNVKHFVQTSSMAAVGGPGNRPANEGDFNTQGYEGWEEAPALAYNYAKAAGERTVWEDSEGKPYTVSSINPSMVWGPSLAKAHAKASPFVFRQALYGNDQVRLDVLRSLS